MELFTRARALFPGGVNSPVRAWGAVGGTPRFVARGAGARVWDVDGNEFVDFVASWGTILLGHAHPSIDAAIRFAQAEAATTGRKVRKRRLISGGPEYPPLGGGGRN